MSLIYLTLILCFPTPYAEDITGDAASPKETHGINSLSPYVVHLVTRRLIARQKPVGVVLYAHRFEALRVLANYKRPWNSTSVITRVILVLSVISPNAFKDSSSSCILPSRSTLLPALFRLSTTSCSVSSLYCTCRLSFVLLSSCSFLLRLSFFCVLVLTFAAPFVFSFCSYLIIYHTSIYFYLFSINNNSASVV